MGNGSISKCNPANSSSESEDESENGDVLSQCGGVVKHVPIEVRPRQKLGGLKKTVSSFSRGKFFKTGGSMKSALSIEGPDAVGPITGPELEKIRRDYDAFRRNKENEISSYHRKEKKLEVENRRLRAELQALQKACSKLRMERDGALELQKQAQERAAAIEEDRDRLQRSFKLMRQRMETEIRSLQTHKQSLESKIKTSTESIDLFDGDFVHKVSPRSPLCLRNNSATAFEGSIGFSRSRNSVDHKLETQWDALSKLRLHQSSGCQQHLADFVGLGQVQVELADPLRCTLFSFLMHSLFSYQLPSAICRPTIAVGHRPPFSDTDVNNFTGVNNFTDVNNFTVSVDALNACPLLSSCRPFICNSDETGNGDHQTPNSFKPNKLLSQPVYMDQTESASSTACPLCCVNHGSTGLFDGGHTNLFADHLDSVDRHIDHVAGPSSPLLVLGQRTGSGKTTLLRQWYSNRYVPAVSRLVGRGQRPDVIVVDTFSSATLRSADSLVTRFCLGLAQLTGWYGLLPTDATGLRDQLKSLLERFCQTFNSSVTLVFLLDSLDRYENAEKAFPWLLDPLPLDVRVIVSADVETCPASWMQWPKLDLRKPLSGQQILQMLPDLTSRTFSDAEANELLTFCRDATSVTPRQSSSPGVGSSKAQPLFVSMIANLWSDQFLADRPEVIQSSEDLLAFIFKRRLTRTDWTVAQLVCRFRHGILLRSLVTGLESAELVLESVQRLYSFSLIVVGVHARSRQFVVTPSRRLFDGVANNRSNSTSLPESCLSWRSNLMDIDLLNDLEFCAQSNSSSPAVVSLDQLRQLCKLGLLPEWKRTLFNGADEADYQPVADRLLNEGRQLLARNEVSERCTEVVVTLATVLLDWNMLKPSLAFLQRYLDNCETMGDPDSVFVADCTAAKGEVYLASRRFQQADCMFRQALDVYQGAEECIDADQECSELMDVLAKELAVLRRLVELCHFLCTPHLLMELTERSRAVRSQLHQLASRHCCPVVSSYKLCFAQFLASQSTCPSSFEIDQKWTFVQLLFNCNQVNIALAVALQFSENFVNVEQFDLFAVHKLILMAMLLDGQSDTSAIEFLRRLDDERAFENRRPTELAGQYLAFFALVKHRLGDVTGCVDLLKRWRRFERGISELSLGLALAELKRSKDGAGGSDDVSGPVEAFQAAAEHFSLSRTDSTLVSQCLLNIALLYYGVGDQSKAVEFYNRALDLSPADND